jgi:hypothetical protein
MPSAMVISMKKPKMVADLLLVVDVCIEASKTRAQLLESRGKWPSKKKHDDREVNTTDHGDCGYCRNRQQQPAKQKERRPLCCPTDIEKWCEIHRTDRHMKECKTFLDH